MGEEEKEEKFKCFLREEVTYFLRSGDTIWSFIIQVSNLNHQPTNHSADATRPVLHVRDFSGARPLAVGTALEGLQLVRGLNVGRIELVLVQLQLHRHRRLQRLSFKSRFDNL